MSYTVKEIFYSLQGEGAHTGRAAVFCRFSGCNLWSGREADRATAACTFCDTDFVGTDGTGGGKYASAHALAEKIASHWPTSLDKHIPSPKNPPSRRFVVLTGGEPLLQLDIPLIDALHAQGFEIALETNGTLPVPAGVDWICVSPKASNALVQRQGQELKVVVPQQEFDVDALKALETMAFTHHFVQPMDNIHYAKNLRWALDWCLQHPQWRLSLQTHKTVGIR